MTDERGQHRPQHDEVGGPSAAVQAALVTEATKKTGLVWVTVGNRRPHPVWHVWHEGAAYVITGGAEQPLPGISDGQRVLVTVPSKETGGRVVSWLADAALPGADTEEWQRVVPQLHAKRLNAADGEDQPRRWARECTLVRLDPTGRVTEGPGAMPDTAHAAPPPDTSAVTSPPLPYVLGRRRRGGRS